MRDRLGVGCWTRDDLFEFAERFEAGPALQERIGPAPMPRNVIYRNTGLPSAGPVLQDSSCPG